MKYSVFIKTILWSILPYIILISACSFSYDAFSENEDDPNLIMENVEYVRIVKGNPEIRVLAEEVRRYEAKHILEADNFSFEQYNAAPERQPAIPDVNAWGKAGKVRLETDTNNFSMAGKIAIDVVSEDISIKTEEVSWQDKERLLHAPGAVHITRSSGTSLEGSGLSVDARTRDWQFQSPVAGSIIEDDDN